MDTLLRHLVSWKLSKYIVSLNGLETSRGSAVVRDVELQRGALHDLLPFDVVRSRVGLLRAGFTGEIIIEDVAIVARPRTVDSVRPTSAERRQAEKREELQKMQEAHTRAAKPGALAQWALGNLRVSVCNVHLRIEDDVTGDGAAVLGVVCERCEMSREHDGCSMQFRTGKAEGLGCYVEVGGERAPAGTGWRQWLARREQTLRASGMLLRPTSAALDFEAVGGSKRLQVVLRDRPALILTQPQYLATVQLLQYLMRFRARAHFASMRPQKPLTRSHDARRRYCRNLWRHAMRALVRCGRSVRWVCWSQSAGKSVAVREEYINLWQRRERRERLAGADQRLLALYERYLSAADLWDFRLSAYRREQIREFARRKVQEFVVARADGRPLGLQFRSGSLAVAAVLEGSAVGCEDWSRCVVGAVLTHVNGVQVWKERDVGRRLDGGATRLRFTGFEPDQVDSARTVRDRPEATAETSFRLVAGQLRLGLANEAGVFVDLTARSLYVDLLDSAKASSVTAEAADLSVGDLLSVEGASRLELHSAKPACVAEGHPETTITFDAHNPIRVSLRIDVLRAVHRFFAVRPTMSVDEITLLQRRPSVVVRAQPAAVAAGPAAAAGAAVAVMALSCPVGAAEPTVAELRRQVERALEERPNVSVRVSTGSIAVLLPHGGTVLRLDADLVQYSEGHKSPAARAGAPSRICSVVDAREHALRWWQVDAKAVTLRRGSEPLLHVAEAAVRVGSSLVPQEPAVPGGVVTAKVAAIDASASMETVRDVSSIVSQCCAAVAELLPETEPSSPRLRRGEAAAVHVDVAKVRARTRLGQADSWDEVRLEGAAVDYTAYRDGGMTVDFAAGGVVWNSNAGHDVCRGSGDRCAAARWETAASGASSLRVEMDGCDLYCDTEAIDRVIVFVAPFSPALPVCPRNAVPSPGPVVDGTGDIILHGSATLRRGIKLHARRRLLVPSGDVHLHGRRQAVLLAGLPHDDPRADPTSYRIVVGADASLTLHEAVVHCERRVQDYVCVGSGAVRVGTDCVVHSVAAMRDHMIDDSRVRRSFEDDSDFRFYLKCSSSSVAAPVRELTLRAVVAAVEVDCDLRADGSGTVVTDIVGGPATLQGSPLVLRPVTCRCVSETAVDRDRAGGPRLGAVTTSVSVSPAHVRGTLQEITDVIAFVTEVWLVILQPAAPADSPWDTDTVIRVEGAWVDAAAVNGGQSWIRVVADEGVEVRMRTRDLGRAWALETDGRLRVECWDSGCCGFSPLVEQASVRLSMATQALPWSSHEGVKETTQVGVELQHVSATVLPCYGEAFARLAHSEDARAADHREVVLVRNDTGLSVQLHGGDGVVLRLAEGEAGSVLHDHGALAFVAEDLIPLAGCRVPLAVGATGFAVQGDELPEHASPHAVFCGDTWPPSGRVLCASVVPQAGRAALVLHSPVVIRNMTDIDVEIGLADGGADPVAAVAAKAGTAVGVPLPQLLHGGDAKAFVRGADTRWSAGVPLGSLRKDGQLIPLVFGRFSVLARAEDMNPCDALAVGSSAETWTAARGTLPRIRALLLLPTMRLTNLLPLEVGVRLQYHQSAEVSETSLSPQGGSSSEHVDLDHDVYATFHCTCPWADGGRHRRSEAVLVHKAGSQKDTLATVVLTEPGPAGKASAVLERELRMVVAVTTPRDSGRKVVLSAPYWLRNATQTDHLTVDTGGGERLARRVPTGIFVPYVPPKGCLVRLGHVFRDDRFMSEYFSADAPPDTIECVDRSAALLPRVASAPAPCHKTRVLTVLPPLVVHNTTGEDLFATGETDGRADVSDNVVRAFAEWNLGRFVVPAGGSVGCNRTVHRLRLSTRAGATSRCIAVVDSDQVLGIGERLYAVRVRQSGTGVFHVSASGGVLRSDAAHCGAALPAAAVAVNNESWHEVTVAGEEEEVTAGPFQTVPLHGFELPCWVDVSVAGATLRVWVNPEGVGPVPGDWPEGRDDLPHVSLALYPDSLQLLLRDKRMVAGPAPAALLVSGAVDLEMKLAVAGVGASLVNGKEVFHVHLGGISGGVQRRVGEGLDVQVTASTLQVDCQVPHATCPVVVSTRRLTGESSVEVVVEGMLTGGALKRVSSIEVTLAQLRVHCDDVALWHGLEYVDDMCGAALQVRPETHPVISAGQLTAPETSTARYLISSLALPDLHARFSYKNTMREDFRGAALVDGRGKQLNLCSIEPMTLQIPGCQLSAAYGTGPVVVACCLEHYQEHGRLAGSGVLGALNLGGVPLSFVGGVGSGFLSLYKHTAAGVQAGGVHAAGGVVKGLARMTGDIVKGGLTGLKTTSAMVGHGFAKVSLDPDFQEQTRKARAEEVKHLGDGLGLGLKALATSVVDGVVGVVEDPVRGAIDGGSRGLARGVARGLAGVVVKPVSGAGTLISKVAEGVRNTGSTGREYLHVAVEGRRVGGEVPLRRPRLLPCCRLSPEWPRLPPFDSLAAAAAAQLDSAVFLVAPALATGPRDAALLVTRDFVAVAEEGPKKMKWAVKVKVKRIVEVRLMDDGGIGLCCSKVIDGDAAAVDLRTGRLSVVVVAAGSRQPRRARMVRFRPRGVGVRDGVVSLLRVLLGRVRLLWPCTTLSGTTLSGTTRSGTMMSGTTASGTTVSDASWSSFQSLHSLPRHQRPTSTPAPTAAADLPDRLPRAFTVRETRRWRVMGRSKRVLEVFDEALLAEFGGYPRTADSVHGFPPPDGHQWEDHWAVDKSQPGCDADGWVGRSRVWARHYAPLDSRHRYHSAGEAASAADSPTEGSDSEGYGSGSASS